MLCRFLSPFTRLRWKPESHQAEVSRLCVGSVSTDPLCGQRLVAGFAIAHRYIPHDVSFLNMSTLEQSLQMMLIFRLANHVICTSFWPFATKTIPFWFVRSSPAKCKFTIVLKSVVAPQSRSYTEASYSLSGAGAMVLAVSSHEKPVKLLQLEDAMRNSTSISLIVCFIRYNLFP